MKSSVIETFSSFSTKFEGCIPYMYLDIKGLVTIGIGNLIDPMETALGLPFVHKWGGEATRDDIILEWRMVKLNKQLAKQGHTAAAKITTLILTEDGIQQLVQRKLSEFETYLKTHSLPNFDDYPADAQLGIMSMAWAMGPGFPAKFPRFTAAVKAQDWNAAAENCYINSTNNPGLVPRNKANRKLFLAAAYVEYEKLNPDNLYGLQTINRIGTITTT